MAVRCAGSAMLSRAVQPLNASLPIFSSADGSEGDGFQGGAALEGGADFGHTLRDGHGCQILDSRECAVCNGGHALRDGDAGVKALVFVEHSAVEQDEGIIIVRKIGSVVKGAGTDVGEAFRHVHGLEGGAAAECLWADGCKPIRECDGSQGGAVAEGTVADGSDAVREGDLSKCCTPAEGAVTDGSDRSGQRDVGQCRTAGEHGSGDRFRSGRKCHGTERSAALEGIAGE